MWTWWGDLTVCGDRSSFSLISENVSLCFTSSVLNLNNVFRDPLMMHFADMYHVNSPMEPDMSAVRPITSCVCLYDSVHVNDAAAPEGPAYRTRAAVFINASDMSTTSERIYQMQEKPDRSSRFDSNPDRRSAAWRHAKPPMFFQFCHSLSDTNVDRSSLNVTAEETLQRQFQIFC